MNAAEGKLVKRSEYLNLVHKGIRIFVYCAVSFCSNEDNWSVKNANNLIRNMSRGTCQLEYYYHFARI